MENAESDDNWFRSNEIQEFVDALEFSADLSKSVASSRALWKWLIISIHNALQGAFVCSIRGADTTGVAVLDRASGEQVYHWLEVESRKINPNPFPEERLASFLELYRRAKRCRYLPHPLPLSRSRDWDFRKLNALRNDFIHFVPKGVSINLSGMPRIISNVCDSIQHLAIDHPTFAHHFLESEHDRIAQSIMILRSEIKVQSP